jgi:hypothetical protein
LDEGRQGPWLIQELATAEIGERRKWNSRYKESYINPNPKKGKKID